MKIFASLLIAIAIAGTCRAQSVETIASINVTSWSASLHGSYADLSTNEFFGYALQFYYGLTDGGTNAGDWDTHSSQFYVTPTDTNDNYGNYTRTIIELAETNTYYYRAAAIGFVEGTVWATNSLTFTTTGASPTSMPAISHGSVTVGTNGVLHWPENFFEANGILPTQGVEQIFIRITSNEVNIVALYSNKLDASTFYSSEAHTNSVKASGVPIYKELSSQHDPGFAPGFETNSGIVSVRNSYGQLSARLRAGGPATSGMIEIGEGIMHTALSSSLSDSNLLRNGHTVWDSGNHGPGSGLNADTLDGLHSSSFITTAGGTLTGLTRMPTLRLTNASGTYVDLTALATSNETLVVNAISTTSINAQRIGVTDKVAIYNDGVNSVFRYLGFGNMHFMIGSGSGTQLVMTGSAATFSTSVGAYSVTATNGPSYFGLINGNAAGVTNIPLTGLRTANSYTGGVMTLRTTDGETFYLE